MKQAIIVFLAMGIFTPLFSTSDSEPQKVQIQKHETEMPSSEALARRDRSIVFLKAKKVPTMDQLPVIEDSLTSRIRSPKEIAERLVACTICAVGGETSDRAFVSQLLRDFGAEGFLSPAERAFLDQGIGVQHERVQYSWRYERSWVLLWALGYIDRLDYPPSICDVPKIAGLLRGKTVAQILQEAKPRSQKELLDQADLIYRLHWAVVDERVNQRVRVPAEVEKGVVQERHVALNWLIGYMGQEWDDISTDT